MEQTLGHVTHDKNLRRWCENRSDIDPMWLSIPFDADDNWQKMPAIKNNWTLKASFRARDLIREALQNTTFDTLMFHTQVTALLSTKTMKAIPTVVSLDATPKNVDTVGSAYNHAPSGNPLLESLKNTLNRRTFRSASHLITWCEWAKSSLISDYGISADKITVIPPGIDLETWAVQNQKPEDRKKLNLLFVGGDFKRKGGAYLMEAFASGLSETCELDIVTREDVATGGNPNIRIHHGLNSNHPDLRKLYSNADVFVFPTLGDCMPIAIMEAMAAGLPVIATNVGALSEEVENGVTGIVIPTNNSGAIVEAVNEILDNPTGRKLMGEAGREQATQKFSGKQNYNRVLDVVKAIARK